MFFKALILQGCLLVLLSDFVGGSTTSVLSNDNEENVLFQNEKSVRWVSRKTGSDALVSWENVDSGFQNINPSTNKHIAVLSESTSENPSIRSRKWEYADPNDKRQTRARVLDDNPSSTSTSQFEKTLEYRSREHPFSSLFENESSTIESSVVPSIRRSSKQHQSPRYNPTDESTAGSIDWGYMWPFKKPAVEDRHPVATPTANSKSNGSTSRPRSDWGYMWPLKKPFVEDQHPATTPMANPKPNGSTSRPSSRHTTKPSFTPSSRHLDQSHDQIQASKGPSKSPTIQSSSRPSAHKKPNILLIVADDVGTGDVNYWNSSLVHTANIEKLSKKGVTFRDLHATPLCAPSRYMLLSGNYQHRGRKTNGSWNLAYKNNQFRPHQKSIAELLREQANYHTAMFGKWHLGGKVPPNGLKNSTHLLTSPRHDWSLPLIGGPQEIGFDSSFITTSGIQKGPYAFFRDGLLSTNISEVSFWEKGSYEMITGESVIPHSGEGDKSWDSSSYNMILVNETSRFLDKHFENQPEDPFFAYVALGSVHIPHSPPNHYLDGSPVAGQYPTKHMDMILEMDLAVGSLVSMIEERQLTEETIIIFTSDNGGLKQNEKTSHSSGGPLRGRKGEIYEGGHRVPFIMRFDGKFPANEERNHLLGLSDVYATICDLIGIDKIPHGSAQDSKSFARYIFSTNDTGGLRQSFGMFDYKTGSRQADALRKGAWKLIRHFNNQSTKVSHIELFNLENDLSETFELSENPNHAAIIEEMLHELIQLGPCPLDVTGSFQLPRGNETFRANCNFFKEKPNKCNKFFEGELYCYSVCGRRKTTCKS